VKSGTSSLSPWLGKDDSGSQAGTEERNRFAGAVPPRLKNTVYFNELNVRVNEKIPTANTQPRERLCSKAGERSMDML
jgi:hypothetical protein